MPCFGCGKALALCTCIKPFPAKPARLDANRKAKPKTKLVAHVPLDGNCHNPSDFIDTLVDTDEEKE